MFDWIVNPPIYQKFAEFYKMSMNRSTNTFFEQVNDKNCFPIILPQ